MASILAFILMIISVFLIFVFESFIGVITTVIALVLSIIQMKKNKVLSVIALIGSLALLSYSVYAFIFAKNVVDEILENAQINARKSQEELLENEISYLTSILQSENSDEIINGENIFTKQELDIYNIEYPKECDVYVVANINLDNSIDNTYKAYLRCDNYITENFDEYKLD